MLDTTFATEFLALADWARPELAGLDREDALAVVRYLRGRAYPLLPHTAERVTRLRREATPEQRAAAEAKIATVLEQPLWGGVHASPLLNLGAETYQLAGTPERFRALAGKVADSRDDWVRGAWGTTHSIVNFLTTVFPLAECPDDVLPPLFCWLNAQLQTEWAWARTWDDGMLGTSGHNWWLHTFGGFWKAGLFFPELGNFAQFAAFAPEYLEREISVLIAPDGFTRERSGYHWGTAQMFMDYTRLAEAHGMTFSDAYYARLRAIANVNWQLAAPDGDIPTVGDTGAHGVPGYLFPLLRREAARYGLPEGKYVAEALNPGGSAEADLREAYDRLTPAAPPTETALADSGYYFMREAWTPAADWVCIDAGARGNTVTSHDHTAVFHLLLHAKGRPILLDNCSGPYGEEPSRLWRVGSASHNVLTVDGQDHLPLRGEWRWNGVVQPTVDAWVSTPGYAYFSGAHEGYMREGIWLPAVRRKLFYLRGGYWVLIDRVIAGYERPESAHVCTQHFHLGPSATLAGDGRVLTSGDGGNLLIVPVNAVEANLEPCPYPLDGYDNPGHLTYTRRTRGNDLFVTLLVPFTGQAPAVDARLADIHADGRTLSPWEATGLEIEINGRRDVYVDFHLQWNLPWTCADYAGSGRLFHSEIDKR
jgi:hypothetical protein